MSSDSSSNEPQPRKTRKAAAGWSNGEQLNGEWERGVFGCTSNWKTCMLGFCCPCFLMYKNAKRVDPDNAMLHCCCLGATSLMLMRREMRLWYGIKRDTKEDCIYVCWCCYCVNCQIANELDARGD